VIPGPLITLALSAALTNTSLVVCGIPSRVRARLLSLIPAISVLLWILSSSSLTLAMKLTVMSVLALPWMMMVAIRDRAV